jgi:hypothetical protein
MYYLMNLHPYLLLTFFILNGLRSDIYEKNINETKLPRRILLCSGKEFNPEIEFKISRLTYIRNDSLEALGKCYGYANCTACKNCRYCKHCNNGGSCGVCAKPKSSTPYWPREMIEKEYENQSNQSNFKSKNDVIDVPRSKADSNNTDYTFGLITFERVNLRESPSIASKIIRVLNINDKVTILEKTNFKSRIQPYGEDYWYKVRFDSESIGWVFGKLISEFDQLANEENEAWSKHLNTYTYVKGNSVNMRSEPFTGAGNIIGSFNFDTKCTIISRTDVEENIEPWGKSYWYKVSCEDKVGWIFGGLLSEETLGADYPLAIIKGKMANVRLAPDQESTILGRVYRNEICMILQKSDHKSSISSFGEHYWYRIRSNRNEGWVFGFFLDEK